MDVAKKDIRLFVIIAAAVLVGLAAFAALKVFVLEAKDAVSQAANTPQPELVTIDPATKKVIAVNKTETPEMAQLRKSIASYQRTLTTGPEKDSLVRAIEGNFTNDGISYYAGPFSSYLDAMVEGMKEYNQQVGREYYNIQGEIETALSGLDVERLKPLGLKVPSAK